MKISPLTFALLTFLVFLSFTDASAQTRAWGSNGWGELGIGNRNAPQSNPQIVPTVPDATAISGGVRHALFLKANGTVAAAGFNSHGQLGDGTNTDRLTPVAVSNLTDITAVSSGEFHSLALRADGTVWAWGDNSVGQLGSEGANRTTPIQVGAGIAGFNDIIAIEAGFFHSIALKADGTVWTWGASEVGRLGDGTVATSNGAYRAAPAQISTLSNVIAVQAGGAHSVALKADGTVWSWGWNAEGQIGNGSIGSFGTSGSPSCACVPAPVQVVSLTGVSQIAAGRNHTVAMLPAGNVFAWGRNQGQIGNGTSGSSLPNPTLSHISNVVEIGAGGDQTIVRTRDGSVWAFGRNFSGELGTGVSNTSFPHGVPQQTLVGTGNSLIGVGNEIGFSAIPSVATPAGAGVKVRGENLNITFASVTASGTTGYAAIDPNAYTPPAEFDFVNNSPAYNLTTTAAFTSATVCLRVTTEFSEAKFNALSVLHQENGVFVDRTVSRNYQKRDICAEVTSFSPFILARSFVAATDFDFDGDGKADESVFRPSNSVWYSLGAGQGFTATQFGATGDKLVPADYDGDGRTDVAVFRAGTWYWFSSSNSIFTAFKFGQTGDVPVPSDYTGDGRAELAVYRNGIWFTQNLATNQFQAVQFGIAADKPVAADFDGDNKSDYAVYRNGIWYMQQSSEGFAAVQFGNATDKAVVGDYDGDQRADHAVYRSGVWYVLGSRQGFYAAQFGIASDTPTPADYDGDGKTDIAVYRQGIWYLLRSGQGFAAVQFGVAEDTPIPSAFVP